VPEKLSATHQEYREARDRGDVLVFIQEGVTREPLQEAFIREVQSWSGGQYTANFSTPDELHDGVIRALHELELSRKLAASTNLSCLDAQRRCWSTSGHRPTRASA
jgi:hypothetical protein